MNDVRKFILEERLKQGLDMRALARKSHVAHMALDKIEKLETIDPQWSTVNKLLNGLGCKVVIVRKGQQYE